MTNDSQSPLGQWSHGLSSLLACLSCTLGIFNISSFAVYSVQFGANFILQFLIMSLIFGIPLFTLHISLGQLLTAGTVDMWRISPIFQGIGIAILTSQAFLGIYSIIGISWMLVYFRDSFITKQDVYRWAEPFGFYREGLRPIIHNSSKIKLEDTVADYFNGVVLQRHNLEVPANSPGHLKFQVTFNLVVVWMIVFICLSKGLKSYGKVVYIFTLVPIFGMFILSSKLVGLMPTDNRLQIVLPETDWSEFFLNTKSWMAASSVSFCTWGLLSAAAMQITSHNSAKHVLHRDASIVIVLTLSVLLLSAFLANTCHQLLFLHGYAYVPSSFERMSTYSFLQPIKSPQSYTGMPIRWMTHIPFVIGDRVIKPGFSDVYIHHNHFGHHRHQIMQDQQNHQESGYQVLRLATELLPATLAVIGPEMLSPFWSVLFYFILILFGIAQQLAIWHCLITGIMAINVKYLKSWETTITFFTCACGFILGLPMATELGVFVVYFLDHVIGGGWWIMLLYLAELVAVFVVRGRPYSGETVVATLFSRASLCVQTWVAPMLSFTWNVILPTILLVMCITVFKNGKFRYFFKWSSPNIYEYWPSWSRQLGCLFQSIPIITVPFIAIVQTCRYLSSGPPDIFDRIQLLYRPRLESIDINGIGGIMHNNDLNHLNMDISAGGQPSQSSGNNNLSSSTADNGINDNLATIVNDPPPKYTPPPSYSTATGARIARMLRQSFRRSVRRLHNAFNPGTSSSNMTENNNEIDNERWPQQQNDSQIQPPPEYSTVLVEMNSNASVMDRDNNTNSGNTSRISELTANQVATLLRSSFRRAMVTESSSSEHLVNAVAPINQDSVIIDNEVINK
ncbi:sodium-dependent transporter bedraggled isoform X2 [Lycorma delicatula]